MRSSVSAEKYYPEAREAQVSSALLRISFCFTSRERFWMRTHCHARPRCSQLDALAAHNAALDAMAAAVAVTSTAPAPGAENQLMDAANQLLAAASTLEERTHTMDQARRGLRFGGGWTDDQCRRGGASPSSTPLPSLAAALC